MNRRDRRRLARAARAVLRAQQDEHLAAIHLDTARWATRIAEQQLDTLVLELRVTALEDRLTEEQTR